MSFLKKLLLCALLFCSREALIAQDASVLIEFESKEKGILIPRMTSNQILGIAEPVDGLMAYDSDQHIFYYFNGVSWQTFSTGAIGPIGIGITEVKSKQIQVGVIEISFSLSDGSTHIVTTPDLTGPQGEKGLDGIGIAQTLSKRGDTLVLSDGGGKVLIDSSMTNELQEISRTGLIVSLSNGGGSYQDSILNECIVDAMVSDNISDSIKVVMDSINTVMDSITVHRVVINAQEIDLNTLFQADTSADNERVYNKLHYMLIQAAAFIT